jgi:hypothetical protein
MDDETPRSMTVEEMRRLFLGHLRKLVSYWATTDLTRPEFRDELAQVGETRFRLNGLVHSILCTLDGVSGSMPAFDLVPSPHKDDEEFNRANGDDWWSSVVINECSLHEGWHKP